MREECEIMLLLMHVGIYYAETGYRGRWCMLVWCLIISFSGACYLGPCNGSWRLIESDLVLVCVCVRSNALHIGLRGMKIERNT